VGRKEKDKKKKRRYEVKKAVPAPENNAGQANRPEQPDQPDLNHLSADWREFYQLVTGRIGRRAV